MQKQSLIRLNWGNEAEAVTTPSEMAEMAGGSFPLEQRVPGAEGLCFDFQKWYAAWRERSSIPQEMISPVSLKVTAADTFEAVIPWEQLKDAVVLYAQEDGAPLDKAGPVRLYVPNGSSACLNVKRVIRLAVALHSEDEAVQASYGFKNVFSPQELRRPN